MDLEEELDLDVEVDMAAVTHYVDCKPDLFDQLCYSLYGMCVTCED